MKKRTFLASLTALPFLMGLRQVFAHTPYRQWKVMRQRYLLIHSYRSNLKTDAYAELITGKLAKDLPDAQARVARARDAQRVGSLITTGQAMLAVMNVTEANHLYRGDGEFKGLKSEMIRTLARSDDLLLISSADFPAEHAWLVMSALMHNEMESDETFESADTSDDASIPMHSGALAYTAGISFESLKTGR